MNLANKLTTFRVMCIPFFVFFMLTDFVKYSNFIALAIFAIASLTDFLDGMIARKNNWVTNFGKFMDPLADKLLVCSALICLSSAACPLNVNLGVGKEVLPVWMVIIIISRELFISGFRVLASDQGIVLAASWWGKFKTAFQMFMIIALIANFDNKYFQIVCTSLIYISFALTIISLIDYIVKNIEVLKN